ncbi:VanZ family protein [Paenibacillus sp. IHBB 3054]|uniref:VanZ family protein n=1 Tax=Paenibacillus sp. IHBB 3054 TaxID=3425689 RepID=UPI003F666C1A
MDSKQDKSRGLQVIVYLLFIVYALFTVQVILFKTIPITSIFKADTALRSVNLFPFHTIYGFFADESIGSDRMVTNVLGNIGIFIPLGLAAAYIGKSRTWGFKVAFVFSVSMAFEIIQYIFALGSSDIDDILLNCAGGVIGIALYKALMKSTPSGNQLLAAIIGFFLLAGIGGGVVTGVVDRSLLPFADQEMEYIDENKQIMTGVDESTADLFGDLTAAQTDAITLYNNPKYSMLKKTADTTEPGQENSTIPVGASTKIIIRHLASDQNKIISTYEEGTISSLVSIVESSPTAPTVRVWLDGDSKQAARMLLVNVLK